MARKLETNASIFLMKRPDKRTAWNTVTQIRGKIFKFCLQKQGREEVVYSLLGQLGIEDGYTITFARIVGFCMPVGST